MCWCLCVGALIGVGVCVDGCVLLSVRWCIDARVLVSACCSASVGECLLVGVLVSVGMWWWVCVGVCCRVSVSVRVLVNVWVLASTCSYVGACWWVCVWVVCVSVGRCVAMDVRSYECVSCCVCAGGRLLVLVAGCSWMCGRVSVGLSFSACVS